MANLCVCRNHHSGPVKCNFKNNKNFHIGYVDKILAFFDVLWNYAINYNGAKKDECYECRLKRHKITIIVCMIADGQNVV